MARTVLIFAVSVALGFWALSYALHLIDVAPVDYKEDLDKPIYYWQQHPQERDAKIAWCTQDPVRQKRIDCQYAVASFTAKAGAVDFHDVLPSSPQP